MLINIAPNTPIVIKPCNHTVLAKAYGVSNKVLHTHINHIKTEIGTRKGNLYSLEQLLIILEHIGMPCYLIE